MWILYNQRIDFGSKVFLYFSHAGDSWISVPLSDSSINANLSIDKFILQLYVVKISLFCIFNKFRTQFLLFRLKHINFSLSLWLVLFFKFSSFWLVHKNEMCILTYAISETFASRQIFPRKFENIAMVSNQPFQIFNLLHCLFNLLSQMSFAFCWNWVNQYFIWGQSCFWVFYVLCS